MKTPIQLLTARKEEIKDQYNAVLNSRYPKGAGRKGHKSNESTIDEFNAIRDKDLNKLKEKLDQYTEAINSLRAIKNMTF